MHSVVVTTRQTLDELLAAASARITRYEPAEAFAAIERGALLIDIRSEHDRERDGIVPGSVHIPRTVLEWRVAPTSSHRNPHVGDVNRQLILICDHGCSSILAAATLVDLGFASAGDVVGGYAAWSRAGLGTAACLPGQRERGEPAGMGAPAGPP
jgi:rhodanese-related sulfurtransferase